MTERVCSVEDCAQRAHCRGWCKRHYTRWLRHGDPLGWGYAPPEACNVDDCTLTAVCRGMCDLHYRRWLKHGSPFAVSRTGPRKCACIIHQCGRVRHRRGLCSMHFHRLERHGDATRSGPPVALRCIVCDHPDGDDRSQLASRIAERLGCAVGTVTKHRLRDHEGDPEWHAKRAAWWIAELAALKGETA